MRRRHHARVRALSMTARRADFGVGWQTPRQMSVGNNIAAPRGALSRRSDTGQISWGKFSRFPCTAHQLGGGQQKSRGEVLKSGIDAMDFDSAERNGVCVATSWIIPRTCHRLRSVASRQGHCRPVVHRVLGQDLQSRRQVHGRDIWHVVAQEGCAY